MRVIGWYHSHPHITVWPSHVGRLHLSFSFFCRTFILINIFMLVCFFGMSPEWVTSTLVYSIYCIFIYMLILLFRVPKLLLYLAPDMQD